MTENRCVCCGDIIPEGRMVCPECEDFEAPCPSYCVRHIISAVDRNILFKQSICLGTKEEDPCSCDGHPIACNYYPEKRAKAEELKNALDLKKLKNEAKKLGYHLVKSPDKIKLLPCPLCGKKNTSEWFGQLGMYRICKCGFKGKYTNSYAKTKKAWNEAVEEYLKERSDAEN